MNKLFTLLSSALLATGAWAQNNIITYQANEKLDEVTENYMVGLHINAFDDIKITSHNFANGKGTITFSSDVISIGERAFWDCWNMTSVSIPHSVTSIGENAFYSCGITSVIIPSSVTNICTTAFTECSKIENMTVEEGNPIYTSENDCIIRISDKTLIAGCNSSVIPSGVTTIGENAFNRRNITSITIPSSVKSIEVSAFNSCKKMVYMTVEEGNPIYTSENNCIIRKDDYTLVVGCDNTVIPSNVTSIGESAFYGSDITSIIIPSSITSIGVAAFFGCEKLISITIPESVTSIESHAFHGCSSLASIAIPNSVTSIGENTFFRCSGLTSITIPSSVNNIGRGAFYLCNSLTTVTCEREKVPSLGTSVFELCYALQKIYVPTVSVAAYKGADNWVEYKDKIVGITPTAIDSINTDNAGKVTKTIENGQIIIIRNNKKYDLSGREL